MQHDNMTVSQLNEGPLRLVLWDYTEATSIQRAVAVRYFGQYFIERSIVLLVFHTHE